MTEIDTLTLLVRQIEVLQSKMDVAESERHRNHAEVVQRLSSLEARQQDIGAAANKGYEALYQQGEHLAENDARDAYRRGRSEQMTDGMRISLQLAGIIVAAVIALWVAGAFQQTP